MSKNAIELPLTEKQKEMGARRRYIPVSGVIDELNKLRDPKMWKPGEFGGADQYLGMPPAIRIIDEIISKLNSPF